MGVIITRDKYSRKVYRQNAPNISSCEIGTGESGFLVHIWCEPGAYIVQRIAPDHGFRVKFARRVGKPFCCKCNNTVGKKALAAYERRPGLIYSTFFEGFEEGEVKINYPVQILSHRRDFLKSLSKTWEQK